MSTSILSSFAKALPSPPQEISARPTHMSGGSIGAEPPKVAFHVPVTVWLGLSREVLQRVGQSLADKSLAAWESTRILRNEADVSCAASSQLMNPVDLALTANHHTQILAYNKYDHEHACADRVWLARESTSRYAPFAVLDYKRVGTILERNFAQALAAGSQARQSQRFPLRASFDDNGEKLMKIATNYAFCYHTSYIAIFDWNSLLLIVMDGMDEGVLGGGDFCRLTIVQDKSQMRSALLGFLEGAYRAAMHTQNDHLPLYQRPTTTTNLRKGERQTNAPKSYMEDHKEEEEEDLYNYTGQSGGHNSRSAYGQHMSRDGRRVHAYPGHDLGMGRLTLGVSRREEVPRSSSRDPRLGTQTSRPHKDSDRPPNPFTPLSGNLGVSRREEVPRSSSHDPRLGTQTSRLHKDSDRPPNPFIPLSGRSRRAEYEDPYYKR